MAISCAALQAEGKKMKKVEERETERERSVRKQSVKGRRETEVGGKYKNET